MSERVRISTKMPEARRESKSSHTRKADYSQSPVSPLDRILFLQRTAGNQAVQRLINSGGLQAKTMIGDKSGQENKSEDAMTKKIGIETVSGINEDNGWSVKGMSASGAGTVHFRYSPEVADKSTKIVCIQVMRELLDSSPVKPSEAAPAFAYQDADTTADFYHVDYVSGEKDPYYNGDDPQDFGTQGNATTTPKIDATTSDTPNYSDASFPVGKSKLTWEFRTIAFSAAGADKGTYYAYAKWAYEKEKGKAAAIKHEGTSTDTALPKSKAAIKLWNTNHGFAMP